MTDKTETHTLDTGDEAAWAALAKELGEEVAGGDEPQKPDAGGKPPAKSKTEPDAKPEEAEDGEEDGGEGEPQGTAKSVSYAQHRNVQQALREAREQARSAREQISGITQLIETLKAGRAQKAEPEAPKQPTLEEDPIGYFQAELAKRDTVIEELKTGTKKTQEQYERQTSERQFWDQVIASEHQMRAKTPDYDEACKDLEAKRIAELAAIYPDDNPRAEELARQHGLNDAAELRGVMLNNDRIAVAQQAMQLGINPAELYYTLAQQRGYKPAAANGKGGEPKVINGRGAAAIEAARRGQKAARTISGGAGSGGPDNPLSLTDLADLYAEDPEEFDQQWDKMARAGKLG